MFDKLSIVASYCSDANFMYTSKLEPNYPAIYANMDKYVSALPKVPALLPDIGKEECVIKARKYIELLRNNETIEWHLGSIVGEVTFNMPHICYEIITTATNATATSSYHQLVMPFERHNKAEEIFGRIREDFPEANIETPALASLENFNYAHYLLTESAYRAVVERYKDSVESKKDSEGKDMPLKASASAVAVRMYIMERVYPLMPTYSICATIQDMEYLGTSSVSLDPHHTYAEGVELVLAYGVTAFPKLQKTTEEFLSYYNHAYRVLGKHLRAYYMIPILFNAKIEESIASPCIRMYMIGFHSEVHRSTIYNKKGKAPVNCSATERSFFPFFGKIGNLYKSRQIVSGARFNSVTREIVEAPLGESSVSLYGFLEFQQLTAKTLLQLIDIVMKIKVKGSKELESIQRVAEANINVKLGCTLVSADHYLDEQREKHVRHVPSFLDI